MIKWPHYIFCFLSIFLHLIPPRHRRLAWRRLVNCPYLLHNLRHRKYKIPSWYSWNAKISKKLTWLNCISYSIWKTWILLYDNIIEIRIIRRIRKPKLRNLWFHPSLESFSFLRTSKQWIKDHMDLRFVSFIEFHLLSFIYFNLFLANIEMLKILFSSAWNMVISKVFKVILIKCSSSWDKLSLFNLKLL